MVGKTSPSAAFEAALATVRRFGEGRLAVVPREPTEAMVRAALKATDGGVDHAVIRAVWNAMVDQSLAVGEYGSPTAH